MVEPITYADRCRIQDEDLMSADHHIRISMSPKATLISRFVSLLYTEKKLTPQKECFLAA